MDIVLLLIRLFLFGVFSIAGTGKLLDFEGSEKAVKDFGAPDSLAKPIAGILPFVEFAIAFSFLFVSTSWMGSIAGILLLLTFIAGMAWQISKGNAPNCHCFGQIYSEPVGKGSLYRNIGFVALAAFLAVNGRFGQGPSLGQTFTEIFQSVLLIILVTGVVIALIYLKKVVGSQKELAKKLDVMEVIARDGVAVERNEAGDPFDALPIGSAFPDFELADIDGKAISFDHLLMRLKPILFLFVGVTCEPCKELLPEIATWKTELAEKAEFVIVSSGNVDENRAKFGQVADTLLLQKKRELSDLVNTKWTPSAIFVRSDGMIASHPAVGDAAIRLLVADLIAKDVAGANYFYHAENGHSHLPKAKIGETAPEFSLTDLDGDNIDNKFFGGKKTLVAFWSLTCPHCMGMLEGLRKWEAERGADAPNLLMFSDGDIEEHRKFGLAAPIIIDEKYKTAQKFGMFGTPSAVLLDEDGRYVSETAVGTNNIWALLGGEKLK